MPWRPTLGEKGIGRLAIALIGDRVLVITRPRGDQGPGPATAAFIDWRLFAIPGATLEDIDIPVLTLEDRLPDKGEIEEMVSAVRLNAIELHERQGIGTLPGIDPLAGLDMFPYDPATQLDSMPDSEILDLREKAGTQFWIAPTNDVLVQDIDESKGRPGATGGTASPLEKFLLGFSNTMAHRIEPPISVSFRDHSSGVYVDRIGEREFFTAEEFENADHTIEGRFDEFGQFKGTVRIYGLKREPFILHWPDANGRPTRCGPFSIRFAYVQGNARESRLQKDDFDAIGAKLNRIGGIYVYRNGIRVLPYGDSEFDYLNIEQRRNRGASYYFFSYRRIFGYIELDSERNEQLVEKAGREGFQENAAYRQFKTILETFFVETAATFFRDRDDDGAFTRERARIEKEAKLLELRRRKVSERRKLFATELQAFYERLNQRYFERRCEDVLGSLGVVTASTASSPGEAAGTAVRRAVATLRAELREVRDDAAILRPRGIGLTRELSRDFARYESEVARLREEVFDPADRRFEETADEIAARFALAPRDLARDALRALREREERRARSLRTEIRKNAEELRTKALSLTRDGLVTVERTIEEALADFQRRSGDDQEIASLQREIEQRITSVAQEQTAQFERMRDAIRGVTEAEIDAETVAALEGELEERRERDLESLELAQMGLALGIVHHEFAGVIANVRRNVRRLKNWADRNPKLRDLYDDISRSYGHLDGYLALFAPLNRRLSRIPAVIDGAEIEGYLRTLLGDRMQRHGVELHATDRFRGTRVTDLQSIIYPAFVNVVDNAIFWAGKGGRGSREGESRGRVVLDCEGKAFVISDNGPGVHAGDRNAAFAAGFSRKPGGSGLGLYVTRTLMERAGYNLAFTDPPDGTGARLEIAIPERAVDAIAETKRQRSNGAPK